MKLLSRLFKTLFKKDLILPLVLLLVYIVFLIVIRGVVPTADELVSEFGELYKKYGYEILFVAAFLESLVAVNLFVPGIVALALGIIFARAGYTNLELVVLSVTMGAISGYLLDFSLGYFGLSDIFKKIGYSDFISSAKKQLEKFGTKGLILGFVHANIGSFMALVAGSTGMRWRDFIFIASGSTFVWVSLWSLLIYSVGDIVLLIIRKYTFLIVLVLIGIMFLGRIWKRENF